MNMFTPEQIRSIRLGMRLSAAEFARLMNVSEDCIWRWERGNRHPTYRKMVMLNDLARKAGIRIKQPA